MHHLSVQNLDNAPNKNVGVFETYAKHKRRRAAIWGYNDISGCSFEDEGRALTGTDSAKPITAVPLFRPFGCGRC